MQQTTPFRIQIWNTRVTSTASLKFIFVLASRPCDQGQDRDLIYLPATAELSFGLAPCGLQDCKIRGPAPFPGRMSYKATKPGSVCPVS